MFVEGALPGERVLALVGESGRVLRGTVQELKVSSPARRAPACPLAGQCGGCDWLHLDEAAQREQKEEIAVSALEHLGGIARDRYQRLPTVSGPSPMGYRRRAVLHRAGRGLGFFGRGSSQTVEVARCPALTPSLAELPERLAAALVLVARDLVTVRLVEARGKVAVSLHLNGGVRERHQRAAQALLDALGIEGAALVPESGPASVLGRVELEEAGGTLVRPDAFAQANAAVSAELVRAANAAVAAGGARQVLELYAGNGNFSIPLAAQVGEVLAVESDPVSLELGRRAVQRLGTKNLRFVLGEAQKVAKGLTQEGRRFDALLLDPPRAGAPGVAGWAKALGVRKVVYVACDPGALARDAGELSRAGFWPKTLQLFDLFPQTRHIEALMVFEA